MKSPINYSRYYIIVHDTHVLGYYELVMTKKDNQDNLAEKTYNRDDLTVLCDTFTNHVNTTHCYCERLRTPCMLLGKLRDCRSLGSGKRCHFPKVSLSLHCSLPPNGQVPLPVYHYLWHAMEGYLCVYPSHLGYLALLFYQGSFFAVGLLWGLQGQGVVLVRGAKDPLISDRGMEFLLTNVNAKPNRCTVNARC